MFIVMSAVEEPDLIFSIHGNSCFFSNTSFGSFTAVSLILCGRFRSNQHSRSLKQLISLNITVWLCMMMGENFRAVATMMLDIFWAMATMKEKIFWAVATMMGKSAYQCWR